MRNSSHIGSSICDFEVSRYTLNVMVESGFGELPKRVQTMVISGLDKEIEEGNARLEVEARTDRPSADLIEACRNDIKAAERLLEEFISESTIDADLRGSRP